MLAGASLPGGGGGGGMHISSIVQTRSLYGNLKLISLPVVMTGVSPFFSRIVSREAGEMIKNVNQLYPVVCDSKSYDRSASNDKIMKRKYL